MVSLIAQATIFILRLMEYAIVGVVLMSWIPQLKDSKLGNILRLLTDPILVPIRNFQNKMMNGRNMMIDFSPLFAIIIINILESVFLNLLKS